MKNLIIILCFTVVGCATQSAPKTDPAPVISATPNCLTARTQIPYLEQQIAVYQSSRQAATPTDEDRKYIGRAKNIIWSLRSTCPASYL